MRADEGAVLHLELSRARQSAFRAREFVEQESFVTASEILCLAHRAGVGPGVSVLDLCCGVAGPGLFITEALGCTYVGVDASPDAVAAARDRARAAGLAGRFEVAVIPPLPSGPFDVVLLLETMLAFRDKRTLLREVASALPVGGRFAFTLEEGVPLTDGERVRMPAADTVWLVPLPDLLSDLERAGFTVRWQANWSRSHHGTVKGLVDAYAAEASGIDGERRASPLDDLVAGHRLWATWLRRGRVRKFAFVAEKVDPCAARGSR